MFIITDDVILSCKLSKWLTFENETHMYICNLFNNSVLINMFPTHWMKQDQWLSTDTDRIKTHHNDANKGQFSVQW